MCEVDVTCLVNGGADPFTLSHSMMEAGAANTWDDAMGVAANNDLEIADRAGVRAFFKGFGAWSEKEIAGWSDQELDALVLQYAASDLRALQSLAPGKGVGAINWRKAARRMDAGTAPANLYAADGRLYISLCD